MTEQRTKILINKLSRLWKELSPDKRRKYSNFETFLKHKFDEESFSGSEDLIIFYITWIGNNKLQKEFNGDFLVYIHFKLNEEDVTICRESVVSYDPTEFSGKGVE